MPLAPAAILPQAKRTRARAKPAGLVGGIARSLEHADHAPPPEDPCAPLLLLIRDKLAAALREDL